MASFPTVDFSQYKWEENDQNYLFKWNNFQTAINILQENINKFGVEVKAEVDSAIGIAQSLIEAYNVNVLEPFKAKCTLGLDFAQGVYFVDDGTERIETTDPESILTVTRSTPKNSTSPAGSPLLFSADKLSRSFLINQPASLLSDKTKQNFLTYSQDFTQWDNNGLTFNLESSLVAPLGTAHSIEHSSPGSNFRQINQAISDTGDISAGFLIKAKSRDTATISITDEVTGDILARSVFDFNTQDFTLKLGQPFKFIEVFNGWFWVYSVIKKSAGTTRVALYPGVYNNQNDSDSVYVSAAQVVNDLSIGSYINTAESTVTTSVDDISVDFTSYIPKNEFTVYVDFFIDDNSSLSDAIPILHFSDDGSFGKGVGIYLKQSPAQIFAEAKDNNGLPSSSRAISLTSRASGRFMAAMSVSHNNVICSANGVSSTAIIPEDFNFSFIDKMLIANAGHVISGNRLQTHIKVRRILVAPYVASAAELNALTAGGQS